MEIFGTANVRNIYYKIRLSPWLENQLGDYILFLFNLKEKKKTNIIF
jgi:hypothetical protein|tara:strand:- start:965 stop:1105 length:141 start_codon:yes stop_codon:yes gene_type:complete